MSFIENTEVRAAYTEMKNLMREIGSKVQIPTLPNGQIPVEALIQQYLKAKAEIVDMQAQINLLFCALEVTINKVTDPTIEMKDLMLIKLKERKEFFEVQKQKKKEAESKPKIITPPPGFNGRKLTE